MAHKKVGPWTLNVWGTQVKARLQVVRNGHKKGEETFSLPIRNHLKIQQWIRGVTDDFADREGLDKLAQGVLPLLQSLRRLPTCSPDLFGEDLEKWYITNWEFSWEAARDLTIRYFYPEEVMKLTALDFLKLPGTLIASHRDEIFQKRSFVDQSEEVMPQT